jgi:hypothetical protein
MGITSKQRRALPDSAFALRGRKYPVPTKAQARKAGIGEQQRLRMGRNALARANQPQTRGSYPTVARVVRTRMGNAIASTGTAKGNISSPGLRGRKR